MQIKRFEAPDMTTALHMVKQAFGPDAVILSARSLRRESGLLGMRQRSGVEVTAATDPQKPQAVPAGARPLPAAGAGALLSPAPYSGRSAAGPARGPVMTRSRENRTVPAAAGHRLRRALAAHEIRDGLVQDLLRRLPLPETGHGRGGDGLADSLATVLEAKNICAPPQLEPSAGPRTIALVGPTGVGKTSAAVRIAAQYAEALEGRVGLISCDDCKVGADAEMASYARLLRLPAASAWSPDAMQAAMDRMRDRALVIVDTPGVSPGQGDRLQTLQGILAAAGAEIHLLVSAASRPGDLERTVDRFSPLDIRYLLVTRLDETAQYGALLHLPTARRLPVSWIAYGPEIPEALRPASGAALARLLLEPAATLEGWRGKDVWVVSAPPAAAAPLAAPPAPGAAPRDDAPAVGNPDGAYVANRNSDIFHRPECKWTRMIKPANMITFDSLEAARESKFHPCRTCCAALAPRAGRRPETAPRPVAAAR